MRWRRKLTCYVVRLLAFAAQAFYDNDGVHIYIVLWKNYYYVLLKNCLIFQWLDMMFHFGCFTRGGIKMRIFLFEKYPGCFLNFTILRVKHPTHHPTPPRDKVFSESTRSLLEIPFQGKRLQMSSFEHPNLQEMLQLQGKRLHIYIYKTYMGLHTCFSFRGQAPWPPLQ